jgi:selenocysteine-specific elongation factor
MIIGMAGHIDHGKTALVRALTGVDTDRLPEEKRRGITIELGFAPLVIAGVGTVGVVDVPGHEGLVRTMLAGASGIDVGLLVIAADEGPMPQTIEHLSILGLLGVRDLVVAITKCDLVDADWLELVTEEVRQLLAASSYRQSPIVATAATAGRGLDELRIKLGERLALVDRDGTRPTNDLFRMPIDRVLTVKGTGLVVAGTVWSGRADLTSSLRVFPGARSVRVRSIRTFGELKAEARPGQRTAFALSGVTREQLTRGGWLVGDEQWEETDLLHAEVHSTDGRPPRPREWVRLHLGTTDVSARVVPAGGNPGGTPLLARLVLDSPILARAGDRFVLRRASPARTIGGGVVTDPFPQRRRSRPTLGADDSPSTRLAQLLVEAGDQGVPRGSLAVRLGQPPGAVEALIRASGAVVVRDTLFSVSTLDRIIELVVRQVDAYLISSQFEPGVPRSSIAPSLAKFLSEVVDYAIDECVRTGRIVLAKGLLSPPGWRPTVEGAGAELRAGVLKTLAAARLEPPSVTELTAQFGVDPIPILRLLEREGLVVPVEPGRFYQKQAVDDAVARMKREMQPGREYGPAELREILGSTRKFLIPFLEYCDKRLITERRTTGRVIREK